MKIQNIKTGIFQQGISYLNKILQVKKNKQSFSNIWELTDCRLYLLSTMEHAAEEPFRDLAFGPEFLYISFFVALFIKYMASFKDREKWICRTFIFINDLCNIVYIENTCVYIHICMYLRGNIAN